MTSDLSRHNRLTHHGFSQGRETRAAPDYTKILPSSRGLKSGESGVGNGEWGRGDCFPIPTPHSHLCAWRYWSGLQLRVRCGAICLIALSVTLSYWETCASKQLAPHFRRRNRNPI